jgi:branched-chain amino acid transport system permease protein
MAALGAWLALRFGYSTELPFPLVLLGAAMGTGAVGILIGLPALRLSGLHLAMITLMAAAVIALVLTNVHFPNGGHGILGYNSNNFNTPTLRRPSLGAGGPAFYRYVVVVAALMFGLVWLHLRGAAGRGWAAIRQSESSALAAGVNVRAYKLWAFGLAALVAGAGGALVAADAGVTTTQFPAQDSITLLAVVLMAGAYSLWGAVLAGILLQLVPAAFTNWGINPDVLQIVFGLGLIQVLLQSPAGIAGQAPKDIRRVAVWLRRRLALNRRPA